ncbi:MAG: TolC family protein [Deltaproteobacteria bacterium]|nr:TolC family protein [Deltaproteobacteria bacterium]
MDKSKVVLLALAALLATGCATTLERRLDADLAVHERELAPEWTDGREAGPAVQVDGRLETYVAYALRNSPALRAKFDEWQAATHRIAQHRRLPEPTFTYGFYVSQVETRVGPQRHRFSLSQNIPWPTQLTAGANAASHEAASAQRRFDAAALTVARRVSAAYWELWLIERTRQVQQDQREVLTYLFESARIRMEVGKSSLADLGQIQLSVSRLTDTLAGLDERKHMATAELLAAMGAPSDTTVTTTAAAPPLLQVAEQPSALRASLQQHPAVESLGLLAASRQERSRSAEAEGFPGFMVGVDYIETGETDMPNVADSGKDAVIVKLGVRIPLWWGAYGAKSDQAIAEGAAFRAKQAATLVEAEAELEKTLARVRDSLRRAQLYRTTLVPQAETVYGSVLGGYQTGESELAQVVLAQRDLLDLQLGLYESQVDHALAWARLEEVVGREVKGRALK